MQDILTELLSGKIIQGNNKQLIKQQLGQLDFDQELLCGSFLKEIFKNRSSHWGVITRTDKQDILVWVNNERIFKFPFLSTSSKCSPKQILSGNETIDRLCLQLAAIEMGKLTEFNDKLEKIRTNKYETIIGTEPSIFFDGHICLDKQATLEATEDYRSQEFSGMLARWCIQIFKERGMESDIFVAVSANMHGPKSKKMNHCGDLDILLYRPSKNIMLHIETKFKKRYGRGDDDKKQDTPIESINKFMNIHYTLFSIINKKCKTPPKITSLFFGPYFKDEDLQNYEQNGILTIVDKIPEDDNDFNCLIKEKKLTDLTKQVLEELKETIKKQLEYP